MEKYIRNTENIASKIEDEIVMVNVTQGNYYALNNVASDIWEMLKEAHTSEEICTQLLANYDISEELCEQEVQAFLQHCLRLKVIETT